MPAPLAPNQVAARLDRLPVCWFHYRFLALICLGAWFDYYDNFVAGTLVVALPAAGVVPPAEHGQVITQLGLFMAALPLGMFLGTIFLGMATDYLGRRFGFVAMLLLYSVAAFVGGAGYYPVVTAAGATAGFVLLLVTRLLAGAGIGAENVVIDAYVTELMPARFRGRAIALTQVAAFTAFPAAALLGRLLGPQRWWLLLVLGSAGALLSWYFRRGLPESPRWSASAGRSDEAAETLERIERAVEAETGQPLPPVDVAAQPFAPRVPLATIFGPRYRARTLLLVAFHLLQTVGYYGFTHFLGAFFCAKQFSVEDSLTMQFTASLVAPVGPLFGVWSAERWERKRLLVGLALFLATGLVTFAALDQAVALTAVAAAIVLGLNWFSATFHAYQAELYPTEARATGVGFTYAWSRASMVAVGLFMPGLLATSLPAAAGVMAVAFAGVALAVGLFGPRTTARPLEEI